MARRPAQKPKAGAKPANRATKPRAPKPTSSPEDVLDAVREAGLGWTKAGFPIRRLARRGKVDWAQAERDYVQGVLLKDGSTEKPSQHELARMYGTTAAGVNQQSLKRGWDAKRQLHDRQEIAKDLELANDIGPLRRQVAEGHLRSMLMFQRYVEVQMGQVFTKGADFDVQALHEISPERAAVLFEITKGLNNIMLITAGSPTSITRYEHTGDPAVASPDDPAAAPNKAPKLLARALEEQLINSNSDPNRLTIDAEEE